MNKKVGIIFILITSICVIGIYAFLCLSHFLYPIKYQESIINYSKQYNVQTELVASVIDAESSFNSNAVSNKGAVGLMQLMPTTAQWLAQKLEIEYTNDLLYNPDYNIRLGTFYLSYLKNKFSDTKVVLCAYNAGEGKVKEWLNNKEYSHDGVTLSNVPYTQTRIYAKKVIDNLKIYSKKLS